VRSSFVGALCTLMVAACVAAPAATTGSPSAPPTAAPLLLGEFVDDYGNAFRITAAAWLQLPHGRFHIRQWHAAEQFLIAENDRANPEAGGRWTRIDWMPLSGMAPYTWAFCFTAYDAPSAAAARAAPPVRRETPRTGCNGYPFSRMRPRAPTDRAGGA
jgi:hypothetical protein